jgi:hypothetical protein
MALSSRLEMANKLPSEQTPSQRTFLTQVDRENAPTEWYRKQESVSTRTASQSRANDLDTCGGPENALRMEGRRSMLRK